MSADEKFSLTQMQQWMQHALVQTGNLPGKNTAEEFVNASQKLSAQRHLNIYKSSYIARLRECMKNQFSGLSYALGEELFQAFADDYLSAYPSTSYTLNDLGKKFPAFLEKTRPDANEEIKESWPDFMIELAQFEFNLSLIFDETAEEKNNAATIDTPDEDLVLTPVFHLFHHHFPICKYYLDFTAKKNPELPFPAESYCAVIRKNYRLGLFEIKPAQFVFLTCMKEGKTDTEALNQTAEIFQFDLQKKNELWEEWRKNFLACGFFVAK